MAHRINRNRQTGKDSFFSVQQKAWHGLGQIVQDYPTSEEAIKHAGLDYEVIKSPLFTHGRGMTIGNAGNMVEGSQLHVPNYFATLRTDTSDVLGVVGKDYEVVQNRDAFSFFDAIVGGGDGILYETAGALGKGERIFITAKLPDYIRVGSDDLIEKYLFLTTSHDGSGSITAAFTPNQTIDRLVSLKADFIDRTFKLVVNCLLYLSIPDKDIEEKFPSELPDHFLTKLQNVKTSRKKEVILQEIKNQGFTRIKIVGSNYVSRSKTGMSVGSVSTHWRKGHWRNQRFGENLIENRLTWIKPTLVNKEKGDPKKGHIYSTS